jgi:hypothetical protein
MLVAAGLTDINVALVVWTTVTFALLIVVLGKFAWGPILQMIETREKTIADALESAKRERAEAEKAWRCAPPWKRRGPRLPRWCARTSRKWPPPRPS